jgi:hypothetical protein
MTAFTPTDAPSPAPSATRRELRELRRRLTALTKLEWPRRYPIVQFPNLPLIVAFAAGLVAHHAHGAAHADGAAISYLAMAIWAYLELVSGVNWFRRLLGLAYVVSTVVHLARALHG